VLKGRKVRLSWSASTDNVGVVGYSVVRSSVQIASPAGTSYTHRPPKGTFTYQVRARDGAGNVSGLSAGVTATT
jgi:chitodextrinase